MLQSSPILSDEEPDTEVGRYFAYLVNKFQNSREKLEAAQKALEDDDMDLKGIHESNIV